MPHRVLDAVCLLVSLAGAALLGAATAGLGSFLQAVSILGLPVGLAVALALSFTAVFGAGLATGSRLGAGLALVAWVATVVLLSVPRPEGDLVLTPDWHTYVWLYGGSLALAACLAVDYRSRTRGGTPMPRT